MNSFRHIPVLLKEAIEALQVTDAWYIDATLGGGGHTQKILENGGKVLGIDQDIKAIEFVKDRLGKNVEEGRLILEQDNFAHLKFLANKNNITEVGGVLFDLGVSSYQIDDSGRGFSFKREEPLDMRMGNTLLTASEIVNTWTKAELVELFQTFGEEHNAQAIAESIIDRRKERRFDDSKDLADVISKVPHQDAKIHPATKVFQALRIAVNNELEAEKSGLNEALEIVRPTGRIVVISFHSLEDRIVKQQFQQWERKYLGKIITKKPLTASEDETTVNKRARSAKMRVFEKK